MKIRGTVFGVLIIRIQLFRVLYRKLPYAGVGAVTVGAAPEPQQRPTASRVPALRMKNKLT